MAETIEELYLKYVNGVGPTLEDDRYFQYLYELISSSENVLHQTNRVLHKVVDEQWLAVIEESLDAIISIIDKPRRFVTTEEEVVPVSLAKKITADSVRHLSMNTQFIAGDNDGDIQPTRILNVSTAETYDLYENRFIYHLIQRLVTFIDKRTDVIFWSTGDEVDNLLSYQSKVDDAYETIEYKLEMTIKNKQSFAENDSDNMQTFMRIDRVRRMVMSLKNSSFCDLMAGCAAVRSPIQRTNLMMKDPSYRTCYKLWQFLENYDEVGYTIVEQDRALEFDEEYLIQLYTHFITGYAVFKSLQPSDARRLDDQTLVRHRRTVKPKFLKQIQEEIVTDYNIPDVEIRKVLVEEVTQAQLDAEAALEEERKRSAELQSQLEELSGQNQSLYDQIGSLMGELEESRGQLQAKEDALAGLQAQLEELRKAGEEERQSLRDELVNLRRTAEAEQKKFCAEAEAKFAELAQAADARIQKISEESGARVSAAEQKAREADAVCQETRSQLLSALAEVQARTDDLARLSGELSQSREAGEAALAAKNRAETELARITEERDRALTDRAQAEELRLRTEEELKTQQEARTLAQQEADAARREAKAMVAEAAEQKAQAEVKAAEAALRAAQEAEARRLVEERAEANRLGKFIVSKLRGKDREDGRS